MEYYNFIETYINMEVYKYLFILIILLILFFVTNTEILKDNKLIHKWQAPNKNLLKTVCSTNNIIEYIPINIDEYVLPKVIYCFWDKESSLINAFINTWRRNIPKDWKIEFITNDNLMSYIDNDFYDKFKELKQVESFRFADFLRFYLLIKNGGVWIDASIIIINGQFLNDYWNEMQQKKAELLMYELEKYSVKGAPYLENWFLMAPRNSKFCKDIYNEFLYSYNFGFHRYKRKILEPNVFIGYTLNGNGIYLMQHAIIIYLLKKNQNKYFYIVKDANESMYKICNTYKWDRHKIMDHITHNDISDLYAIKINGYQRQAIKDVDAMIKKLDSI